MRQPLHDPQPAEWQILSTYVPHRDGPRRLEQAFRLLLGSHRPPDDLTPLDGSPDHACSDLRPRLDRPPGARPDD
jgi:hypothetical protein